MFKHHPTNSFKTNPTLKTKYLQPTAKNNLHCRSLVELTPSPVNPANKENANQHYSSVSSHRDPLQPKSSSKMFRHTNTSAAIVSQNTTVSGVATMFGASNKNSLNNTNASQMQKKKPAALINCNIGSTNYKNMRTSSQTSLQESQKYTLSIPKEAKQTEVGARVQVGGK